MLVGGVALLEYAGVLPHVAIVQPARYRDPLFVGTVLVFFTVSCYVMAYFCMSIARRLRRRETELGGLYDGVRDVTSTLDITAVLDRIVEAAARVLTCKAAAIRLIDQSRSQVEFAASWGLSETYRDEVPAEYARSVLDQDTLRDGVVHVTDVEHDPRIWHPELVRDERIASMLSVAIRGRTGPIGVLRAYGAPGPPSSTPRTSPTCRRWRPTAPWPSRTPRPTACWPISTATSRSSCASRPTSCARPVRVTESLLMTLADGLRRVPDARAGRRAQARPAAARVAPRAHRRPARPGRRQGRHGPDPAQVRRPAGRSSRRSTERFRTVADGEGPRPARSSSPATPLEVFCDPGDLERIVVNLVGNAVKYTPAGEVRVTLGRTDGRVRFEVADTGIGIPKDALPHLFNEFYRAGNAKAAGESGTGLGLAIVKLLVARYGGEIAVASEEGQGTTMTVTPPPSPAPGSVQASREPSPVQRDRACAASPRPSASRGTVTAAAPAIDSAARLTVLTRRCPADVAGRSGPRWIPARCSLSPCVAARSVSRSTCARAGRRGPVDGGTARRCDVPATGRRRTASPVHGSRRAGTGQGARQWPESS